MKLYCSVILTVIFLVLISGICIASDTQVLAWEDCVKEAKSHNPDLTSAYEKLNQAKCDKTVASSSSLPQLSACINGSTQNFSSGSLSYSLSTQMTAFDGFKTLNSILQAEEQIKYAQANYDSVSSNVRSKLKAAFNGLLQSQQYINIVKDIAKRRKQSADMVKLRYNSGREHKGSVLIAQANLNQAEYDIRVAERNLEMTQKQLSTILGRDKFKPIVVNSDFNLTYTEKIKPDFNKLAESNPTVKTLAIQKKIAEYALSSAEGSYFPTINLSAGYGNSILGESSGGNLTAGIGLSYSLFDFGGRDAQVSKTKSLLLQSETNEKSGILSVILVLEDSWIKLQNAIDNVGIQKSFLEANTERTKITEAQYSEGTITFDNWTIIEDNLVNIQKSYLNIQANALNAESDWINAIGGTLDYDSTINGGVR